MNATNYWREKLPSQGMPLGIISFILIFLAYYFVQMPLRELAMFYSLEEFVARYSSFKMQMITTNGLVVFLGQALGVYLVCYYTYKRLSILWTVGLSLFVWISMTLIRYLFDQVVFEYFFDFQNYVDDPTLFYYVIDNIYWGGNYCVIGIVIYFIRYALFSERQRGELEIQNRTTELAFLRSQINPHFLFNTLNNLYSLIYTQSENALKVVEKLSGLLRYSLYEVESTVSLEQEVKYLYDFIELEKLRYDFPVALQMDLTEDIAGVKVPPFLFIPFVENAFKHGDLRNPEEPLQIYLNWNWSTDLQSVQVNTAKVQIEDAAPAIQAKDTMPVNLVFKCSNKIKSKQKDKIGGIGLENVKKRLGLLYSGRYDLKIDKSNDTFSVQLKIPIQKNY